MDVGSLFMKFTTGLVPSYEKIRSDLNVFSDKNGNPGRDELARSYADRICWKYASLGVVTTLPGAIPGIGTAAMLATESATISGNLAMMIRWMGSMVAGISMIYEREVEDCFHNEFILVMGLWGGVVVTEEESVGQTFDKVVINQQQIPRKIIMKINQKVGTSIIKRRGGVAIGTLAPFGVGAIVGGSFNLALMKAFKQNTLKYYKLGINEVFYFKG